MGDQPVPLITMLQQLFNATRQCVPCRLIPSDEDQQCLVGDLVISQSRSIDFGVDQDTEQVVGGLRAAFRNDVHGVGGVCAERSQHRLHLLAVGS